MNIPELLLPAGNIEKARTAFLYGADAIYLGGKEFSLRAYAGNLNDSDIELIVNEAHQAGKKVYITVNVLAHNRDLKRMASYLEVLGSQPIDGLIISDPGVLRLATQYAPQIPVTISTQANVTNYESALVFRELGAVRIVLARELSLEEIREIKEKALVEIEVFIHGAMCVSYSGRCLLSHFMTGRSANQGACAHPCRYKYFLQEEKRPGEYYAIEEDERGTYIMNSRDLCLLEYIPDLMEAGIDSFKIEGRMKSPLYVASTASVYRQAIDYYSQNQTSYPQEMLDRWKKELAGVAPRPFTTGFITGEQVDLQDVNNTKNPLGKTELCGIVRGYKDNCVIIEQKSNFGPGDRLEFFLPNMVKIPLPIEIMYDQEGNEIDRARHPKQHILVPWDSVIMSGALLRRVEDYY